MKTKVVLPESVLSKKSKYIITNGTGNVIILSEIGSKARNIDTALKTLGINFHSGKTIIQVQDLINHVKKFELNMEFCFELEGLKKSCPSLYEKLSAKEKDDQLAIQYFADNAQLN